MAQANKKWQAVYAIHVDISGPQSNKGKNEIDTT